MYIVIEGQDGTGKDTQAKKLKEYFESQGKRVVAYAESGTASEDELERNHRSASAKLRIIARKERGQQSW